jgi:hypothetical protein
MTKRLKASCAIIDSLPSPKARGAKAEDFMDATLMDRYARAALWETSREEKARRVGEGAGLDHRSYVVCSTARLDFFFSLERLCRNVILRQSRRISSS